MRQLPRGGFGGGLLRGGWAGSCGVNPGGPYLFFPGDDLYLAFALIPWSVVPFCNLICTLDFIRVRKIENFDLYLLFLIKSLVQIREMRKIWGTDQLICTLIYLNFLDLYLLFGGTDQENQEKQGYRSSDLYPCLSSKTWSKINRILDWSVQLILDQAFEEKQGYRSRLVALYPCFPFAGV